MRDEELWLLLPFPFLGSLRRILYLNLRRKQRFSTKSAVRPPLSVWSNAFTMALRRTPTLRPMYPADLTESKRHMALFLMQYFGGPTTYSQERGHPRLRMRHLPFSIGQAERDAWMRHMTDAVKSEMPTEVHPILLDYFDRVATFMMNRKA